MSSDKPPIVREVHADLACRECGYNLRSLRFDQSCPECGTDVEWSTHGHLLRYASVRWLRSLHLGLTLWFAAIILAILALFTSIFGAITLHGPAAPYMALTLFCICVACSIAGSFFLTAVEPRIENSEPIHSTRRITRLLSVLAAISCFIDLVVQFRQVTSSHHIDTSIYDMIAAILWLALLISTIRTMSIIARRSSYDGMTERMNFLLMALFVAIALTTVSLVLGFNRTFDCSCCCGALLINIAFFCIFLVNLSELRNELRTAIRISASRPWRAPSVQSLTSSSDSAEPSATEPTDNPPEE